MTDTHRKVFKSRLHEYPDWLVIFVKSLCFCDVNFLSIFFRSGLLIINLIKTRKPWWLKHSHHTRDNLNPGSFCPYSATLIS